jgi:hypothetical protein
MSFPIYGEESMLSVGNSVVSRRGIQDIVFMATASPFPMFVPHDLPGFNEQRT